MTSFLDPVENIRQTRRHPPKIAPKPKIKYKGADNTSRTQQQNVCVGDDPTHVGCSDNTIPTVTIIQMDGLSSRSSTHETVSIDDAGGGGASKPFRTQCLSRYPKINRRARSVSPFVIKRSNNSVTQNGDHVKQTIDQDMHGGSCDTFESSLSGEASSDMDTTQNTRTTSSLLREQGIRIKRETKLATKVEYANVNIENGIPIIKGVDALSENSDYHGHRHLNIPQQKNRYENTQIDIKVPASDEDAVAAPSQQRFIILSSTDDDNTPYKPSESSTDVDFEDEDQSEYPIYEYAQRLNTEYYEEATGYDLQRKSSSSEDDSTTQTESDEVFLQKPQRTLARIIVEPPDQEIHRRETTSSDEEDLDNEEDIYGTYEYYWNSDEFSEDDEIYGNLDAETNEKLVTKRKKTITELVTTESSYVTKLRMVFKTSIQIEGANMHKEMFPSSILKAMFPCVEELHIFHSEILLPALKTRLEQWSSRPSITDLWIKYIPYLSMYKNYTSQFSEAMGHFSDYRKSKPEFNSLLEKIEKRGEFKKLGLEHHMLEPVQRLGRYKLLLQDYQKHLLQSEEEWDPIKGVIESLDMLIKGCEQTMMAKTMFEEFQKVQNRLDDTMSVLNPNAKLLKEGPVTEITSRNYNPAAQRYLFLFTDFLLVCRKRGPSTKYSIMIRLDTAELRVRPAEHLIDLGYSSDVTMLVKGREKVLALMFSNMDVKDDWEEELLKSITLRVGQKMESSSLKDTLKGYRNSVLPFSRAPEWIPDDSVQNCQLCEMKFIKVLKRRHHCRGCGHVVCSKCSTNKMALPYQDNKVSKVCDRCFIRGREVKPELTRRISTARRKIHHVRQDNVT